MKLDLIKTNRLIKTLNDEYDKKDLICFDMDINVPKYPFLKNASLFRDGMVGFAETADDVKNLSINSFEMEDEGFIFDFSGGPIGLEIKIYDFVKLNPEISNMKKYYYN